MITSAPSRAWRAIAAIASAARSHTTVSGVGKPRLAQQRRRVELVDRALDGARRVDHRHAAILDPVQRVHAIDDLLERAVGDDAREHGVGVDQGSTRPAVAARPATLRRRACCGDAPARRLNARDAATRTAHHVPDVAARRQRAAQLVGVPAGARAEDRRCSSVSSASDVEQRRASTPGLRRPA